MQFVVPDLKINDWERVSEDTPWRAQAMSYDKFNKVGNSLLAHLGADKSVLDHRGESYKFRRFMPSAAEALGVDPEGQQGVGNWQDIPKAARSEGKPRASFPMHRHYAADIIGTSAETKGILLVALEETRDKVEREGPAKEADTEAGLQLLRSECLDLAKLQKEWHTGCWSTEIVPASPVGPVKVAEKRSPEHASPSAVGMSPKGLRQWGGCRQQQ